MAEAGDVRRLHLLRHAKSSWADPGREDRDRPLAPRGRRAARRLAGHLRDLGVRPDLVLCSPAVRTRQTLELVQPGLGAGVDVRFEEELYAASADGLLDRLRQLPESAGAALVVGHNPGLQELVLLLARRGSLRERAAAHFPTAALATLSFGAGGWAGLTRSGAELVSYVVPRELS